VDAASGAIAIARDLLRTMLANTTAFRTWDGATYSEAQALARIYQGSMPLATDCLSFGATLPFAVITKPSAGTRWRSLSTPRGHRAGGELIVQFFRAAPAEDASDPGKRERSFENFIGNLIQSGNVSTPGLAELANTSGYLALRDLHEDGPYPVSPEDFPGLGDVQLYLLGVNWGMA
jgi:hypothetical protein